MISFYCIIFSEFDAVIREGVLMHRFDYRFLTDSLPANILEIVGIIYDLRGRGEVRKNEHPQVFQELRHTAMIDSIQSSNAIEGIVTTAERMKALVNQQAEPYSHDEQEILGYRDVLNEIFTGYEDMEISDDLLKHFHQLMLGATAADAGQYKQQNNWIQERDDQGRITVRFMPVRAKETPDAMEQLILAYHEGKQNSAVNGLLLTACVIVDFLCIHPFRDGNGRVSRLFTSLLLLQEGFDIGRYISVDKKINEYKYNYYQALKTCSDGWHDNRNTYIPFIIYLLQILYSCYKDLDNKFVQNTAKKISKAKQIENTLLQCYVPVSKEEIAGRFPEISITTVERVLGKLVREGKIEKIGTYRNARYRKI